VDRENAVVSAEAPGRIEVLGNHTDYHEGMMLGAAIDRAVRVRGTARHDGRISLRSTFYPPVELAIAELRPQQGNARWANYLLGVAGELLARGLSTGGFTAEIQSDLPIGAGLGSSGAVAVATAFFLLKLSECELPPLEVAKICQRAEHRFAGVQSGLLDQVMSIFGQANHLLCFDCRTEEVHALPFPDHLALIVADTGIKRELAAGKYNERRAETRGVAQMLGVSALRDISAAQLSAANIPERLRRRAAHVIGENERVRHARQSLERGDASGLGQLMSVSHESSRTNFENSTPELDELVELARKQPGVLGARLTGGGFGGAVVALCERAKADQTVRSLASAAAQVFVCRPADGALARN
jgi:galactokinase